MQSDIDYGTVTEQLKPLNINQPALPFLSWNLLHWQLGFEIDNGVSVKSRPAENETGVGVSCPHLKIPLPERA